MILNRHGLFPGYVAKPARPYAIFIIRYLQRA